MKVKTRIVFEVEYPLDLGFYDTDEGKALRMEKAYVGVNPLDVIEAHEARGDGVFTTSVEIVE